MSPCSPYCARRSCARLWFFRHGLEVLHDRVDLCRLEMILEARHARGAVCDYLAHDVVLAAERCLGERRPKGPAGDLRLEVAHGARVAEPFAGQSPARVED